MEFVLVCICMVQSGCSGFLVVVCICEPYDEMATCSGCPYLLPDYTYDLLKPPLMLRGLAFRDYKLMMDRHYLILIYWPLYLVDLR